MRTQGHLQTLIRNRDFRRLIAVRLTSQGSDGLFQASLALSVFFSPDLQAGPLTYAFAFLLLIGPYSLLGPYVGVFLDRYSRQRLILSCNISRGALALITGIILTSGPQWIWVFSAMLILALNRFTLAGLTSAHPHIVDDEELVTANSLASTLGALAFGLGISAAGVVGILDGGLSYSSLAIIAGFGYLISAVLATKFFTAHSFGPTLEVVTKSSLGSELADTGRGLIQGFAYLRRNKGPGGIIALQGLHRLLYGVIFIISIVLFLGFFHDPGNNPNGEDTLRWLLIIALLGNVGVAIAAFVTPSATRKLSPGMWVVGLLALCSVMALSLSATMVDYMFAIAVIFINIASQGIKITVETSLQAAVEDQYRGRLFSLNDTVYNGGYIIGMFIGAAAAPVDGYTPGTLAAVAAVYLLASVGYAFFCRKHAPYDTKVWSLNNTTT